MSKQKAQKAQKARKRQPSAQNESQTPSPPPRNEPTPPLGLRFSLEAVTQLKWFLARTPNEVGCWGICEDADQPLYVTRLRFPEQQNSPAFVSFDDMSNLKILGEETKLGLEPWQVQRVWIHTHPGNSPRPSGTDEDTLDRISAQSPWFVMFIMAKGWQTYARLRCRYIHPVTNLEIEEDTDLPVSFDSYPRNTVSRSDLAEWEEIFQRQCNEAAPRRNLERVRVGQPETLPTGVKNGPPRELGGLLWPATGRSIDEEEMDLLMSDVNFATTKAEGPVPAMDPFIDCLRDMTVEEIWGLEPRNRELLLDCLHWEYKK